MSNEELHVIAVREAGHGSLVLPLRGVRAMFKRYPEAFLDLYREMSNVLYVAGSKGILYVREVERDLEEGAGNE
jgi:hypothetical protein